MHYLSINTQIAEIYMQTKENRVKNVLEMPFLQNSLFC